MDTMDLTPAQADAAEAAEQDWTPSDEDWHWYLEVTSDEPWGWTG